MSIRVKCENCGSVLKVKNELAGTTGKCPNCKGKLNVPFADDGDGERNGDANAETRPVAKVSASSVSPPPEKPKPVAPPPPPPAAPLPPPPAPAAAKKGSDDFDVDAFLSDDSAPNAKKSAGLAAAAPEPAKAQPVLDKYGRRSIVAPPPSPPKPGDTAAAISANSALNASANARDLLSKTMDETRSVSPAALGKPRVQIDWKLSGKELIKPALIGVGTIGACIVLYFVGVSMFGEKVPMPRLAEVTGTVTLNKQPLENVTVILMPVQPRGLSTKGKEIGLRAATGVTDANGYYRIWYYEGVNNTGIPGAPADTKVRMGVTPNDPRDMGRIPEKYQRPEMANDIREVKPTGNEGRFNIEL